MIEEAYVSFETARLLREKGFDVSCYGRYSVRSKEFHLDCTKAYNNGSNFMYSAPTQQMAMSWLRKMYNVNIEIRCKPEHVEAYIMSIETLPRCLCRGIIGKIYEEVNDQAIKYCLENLI